ncbi:hypothetical protein BDN70DRAFT_926903 [Pholiota conissans]|uniref:Uncharacterized protein n=1 Tax=Pholiota conissans TaxID=109636 RepID=A0A9P5ZFN7_9AGAR|nr:hypothetical protein BDN70DRAFT_926903 [Pholiota conissans]
MLTGNKRRLYLGYWARHPSPANPTKYHTGLLLTSKNPKSDEKGAVIFHANNRIDADAHAETWKFEARPTMPRTAKLAGCMLLGKVPPKFQVEVITELLSKVHVPSPEDAGAENWRCRHWILDALTLLQTEGVIPELPDSLTKVLDNGYEFVEKKTQGNPIYEAQLYTCDTSGKEISSELPGFNMN